MYSPRQCLLNGWSAQSFNHVSYRQNRTRKRKYERICVSMQFLSVSCSPVHCFHLNETFGFYDTLSTGKWFECSKPFSFGTNFHKQFHYRNIGPLKLYWKIFLKKTNSKTKHIKINYVYNNNEEFQVLLSKCIKFSGLRKYPLFKLIFSFFNSFTFYVSLAWCWHRKSLDCADVVISLERIWCYYVFQLCISQ